jgi:hypothetical protein
MAKIVTMAMIDILGVVVGTMALVELSAPNMLSSFSVIAV